MLGTSTPSIENADWLCGPCRGVREMALNDCLESQTKQLGNPMLDDGCHDTPAHEWLEEKSRFAGRLDTSRDLLGQAV